MDIAERYPAIVQMRCKCTMGFPIHNAVYYQASSEIVEYLLQVWPEGASRTNGQKMLPLHLAASQNSDPKVIKALLKAYPQAASIPIPNGASPLSALCNREDANLDSIKYLIEASPESVQWKDEFGGLPVHYACLKGADWKVIKLLVKNYPQSILMKTSQGMTCQDLATLSSGAKNTTKATSFLTKAAQHYGRNKLSSKESHKEKPRNFVCSFFSYTKRVSQSPTAA